MKRNKTGLFFTKGEERANAISHGVGAAFGLMAGAWLLHMAYAGGNRLAVAGVWLYVAGMMGSYVSSTLYHSLRHHNPWRPRLRQWDHAAIYWHIAGSYSPLTLTVLFNQNGWGIGLFAFVWTCAAIGTAASFRRMEEHSHLETVCFLLMGLSILVAFKPLLATAPEGTIHSLIAEGICYLTGAVCYSVRRIRYMHSAFHLFVLGGTVSHIGAVWHILDKMP